MTTPQVAAELRRRREVMPSTYRLFYRRPVMVAHAEGAEIIESDGSVLIDAYNNVPVVGHANPVVAERVGAQLRCANTHTRYLIPSIAEFAEKLLARFEASLDRVIFTSSGSEANDLAVQVSRVLTGHTGVIVTGHAYHGTTAALHALSPSLSRHWINDQTALLEVPRDAPSESVFRSEFLVRLDDCIEQLNQSGHGVAAILIDSLLTSDGVYSEPAGLLADAAERVRAAGGLWIADEVQSGFGRAGSWWGYQRHGEVPDLVVLGKPMGNGLPVAALVGPSALLDSYGERFRYFNTFGGNPVCLAAADAVIDEIERHDLLRTTRDRGEQLRTGLARAAESAGLPYVVRGAGLMVAVDTGVDRVASLLADLLRERGVLVGVSGPHSEVLKIRPPLVVTEDQIAAIVSRFTDALSDAEFVNARTEPVTREEGDRGR